MRGVRTLVVAVVVAATTLAAAAIAGAAIGRLTYQGCITGESDTLVCTQIPLATPGGADSGLDGPQFMDLSPDDESLYVGISRDDGVATFSRAK